MWQDGHELSATPDSVCVRNMVVGAVFVDDWREEGGKERVGFL